MVRFEARDNEHVHDINISGDRARSKISLISKRTHGPRIRY